MTSIAERREARLRRAAARQGLALVKSRSRTASDYLHGTYGLVDPGLNAWVAMDYAYRQGYGLDLDEIEMRLAERAPGH